MVVTFAPALALVDLFRYARLGLLVGRRPWTPVRSLVLDAEALCIGLPPSTSAGNAERVLLREIAGIQTWQIDGDAGFSDANVQTHFVRVALSDGTERRLVHRGTDAPPFEEAALGSLRARGLAGPATLIAGPARGLARVAIHGLALLWCAAAAGALWSTR